MTRQSTALALQRASWGAVMFVVVIVPLVTTNPTMLGLGKYPFTHDQIELPRAVLLQLSAWFALGCWALAGWVEASRIRLHRALTALAAFLLLATASTIASPFVFQALFGDYRHYEGLFMFLAYAGLCFVTMQIVNPVRLTWLARLMTSVGVLLASYGVEQSVWRDPANWLSGEMPGRRAFATWGNPDFFGGYLLFPLAFTLAVMLADESRGWRVAGFVGTVLTLFAIVATNTRGAWFAALAVVLIMFTGYVRKGYSWKWFALFASVALVVSGMVLNKTSGGFLFMRISTAFASNDSGLAARIGIWRGVLRLIKRSPLLGTGPDTIVPASLRYFGYAVSNDAHNYLLHIALGCGVLAAIGLYTFFVWALFASAGQALSSDRGVGRFMLTATWAASAGYLVHLMAGLSMITSTSLLYICIGALLGSVSTASWSPERAVAPAVGIVCGALVVAVLLFGARAVAADHAFFEARLAARTSGDRVGRAEEAVRLNPYNARYREELDSARGGGQ